MVFTNPREIFYTPLLKIVRKIFTMNISLEMSKI